jgi:hypothetical protein
MFHCYMNASARVGAYRSRPAAERQKGKGGWMQFYIRACRTLFPLSRQTTRIGSNPFARSRTTPESVGRPPTVRQLVPTFAPEPPLPDRFYFPFLRLIVSTTEPSLSFSACLTGLIFPVPASLPILVVFFGGMCHSPRSALIVLRPDRLRPGRSREIIADSTKPSEAQVPYKGEDTKVLKLSGSRKRIGSSGWDVELTAAL